MDHETEDVVLSADLVDLLQDMGLTRTEVQVYQYLLNAGAAVPSAIARDTGQPRGRIYEGMRNLVEKGFAREEPTRPIRFLPTPLVEVLAAARSRLSRQLLAVKRGEAVATQASVAGQGPRAPQPVRLRDIRVISGRRACYAEMGRMLARSERFFWLMGGGNLPQRLGNMPSLLSEMQAAADRGVDVQLMLPHAPSLAALLSEVRGPSGHLAVHTMAADQAGPLVTCAIDDSTLEVIAQPDDESPSRGDDVAIQISSPLMATAAQRSLGLARSLVKGRNSPPVFQWLGPNHGADLFLQAARNAKSEVVVLGPQEWTNYLGMGWDTVRRVYAGAAEQGVKFRALVMGGEPGELALERFSPPWEFRIADSVPIWLTIVDGKDLFQAFMHPSLGGPPQFRHSRHPYEVAFFRQLFERLWEEGSLFSAAPTRSLVHIGPTP